MLGKNPEKKNSATPPPSVAAKEWKTTTHDAGRLAALKRRPVAKPNPMLGSILRFPGLTVSYCTLANKHVTIDALAYHCLRHDLSTFPRGISFQDLTRLSEETSTIEKTCSSLA